MASEHVKCAKCSKDFVKRAFRVSAEEHVNWCLKCNGDANRIPRAAFIEEQRRVETAPAVDDSPSYVSPSIDFGSSFGGGGDSGGGFSGGGGDSGGGGASGGW